MSTQNKGGTTTVQKKSKKKEYDYKWCGSCLSSHNQGKGHIYTKKHKEYLLKFLLDQYTIIKGIKHFIKNPTLVDPSSPDTNFKCFCCDKEIEASNNKWIW